MDEKCPLARFGKLLILSIARVLVLLSAAFYRQTDSRCSTDCGGRVDYLTTGCVLLQGEADIRIGSDADAQHQQSKKKGNLP
jgi:hypothetical protein